MHKGSLLRIGLIPVKDVVINGMLADIRAQTLGLPMWRLADRIANKADTLFVQRPSGWHVQPVFPEGISHGAGNGTDTIDLLQHRLLVNGTKKGPCLDAAFSQGLG